MAGYHQPRRLNFVSGTLLIILAALLYGGYKFGPPYFRKWRVKAELDSSLSLYFTKRYVADEELYPFIEKLTEDTKQALLKEGVEDPGLVVEFEKDKKTLFGRAFYQEIIKHPFVDRTTTLKFEIDAQKEIKSEE